jgi:hypothetical protein
MIAAKYATNHWAMAIMALLRPREIDRGWWLFQSSFAVSKKFHGAL